MISICVTVKNRSRVAVEDRTLHLFPRCVDSIVKSASANLACELVVADWLSDDWPLSDWLVETAQHVPTKLVTLEGHFSRGRGLNEAARSAGGNVLLFIDADALLCEAILARGLECVRSGNTYFPVLYSFDDAEHRSGRWLHAGYGHCMVSSDLFLESGGWPEYDRWGKEDDDFLARVASLSEIVREEVPGFYHQWHPDDIGFKDRYSARSPFLNEELAQIEMAWRELKPIVSFRPFILVDEARFGKAPADLNQAFPFLERDGEYWGPPANDATAILELERLRIKGATHIVFAWMARWWLDYYVGLRQHLESNFELVLANERLTVFDLRMQRASESKHS